MIALWLGTLGERKNINPVSVCPILMVAPQKSKKSPPSKYTFVYLDYPRISNTDKRAYVYCSLPQPSLFFFRQKSQEVISHIAPVVCQPTSGHYMFRGQKDCSKNIQETIDAKVGEQPTVYFSLSSGWGSFHECTSLLGCFFHAVFHWLSPFFVFVPGIYLWAPVLARILTMASFQKIAASG